MSDKFNQVLNFAADPPDGGGGTKITPIGGSGATVQEEDSTADAPPPADPPDGSGGTGSTAPSNS